jgi:hypothetical protein
MLVMTLEKMRLVHNGARAYGTWFQLCPSPPCGNGRILSAEGGCFCDGRKLKAGDYHHAEANTEHHDASSDEGCFLLINSSPHNEMLP